MPEYKAPLRDIKFVTEEVLDVNSHYANLPGAEEATPDMIAAILEEGAKFAERVLSPLNRVKVVGLHCLILRMLVVKDCLSHLA